MQDLPEYEVTRVDAGDDLAQLVEDIRRGTWDEANDVRGVDVESLRIYLERQDTRFVVCRSTRNEPGALFGFASSRVELKPYGNERWLYVDEVDVCADRRREGVGTALMHKLFQLAEQAGCSEVWLATEPDNIPANGLYRSLHADESATVVGYVWRLEPRRQT
jgi:ribosomal protein S18 acetylase RimI-like enzyme